MNTIDFMAYKETLLAEKAEFLELFSPEGVARELVAPPTCFWREDGMRLLREIDAALHRLISADDADKMLHFDVRKDEWCDG